MPRQPHDVRLDAVRAGGGEMREEAVVAEAQRHGVGRRAQHRVGADARRAPARCVKPGFAVARARRASWRISSGVTSGMSAGTVMQAEAARRAGAFAAPHDRAGVALAGVIGARPARRTARAAPAPRRRWSPPARRAARRPAASVCSTSPSIASASACALRRRQHRREALLGLARVALTGTMAHERYRGLCMSVPRASRSAAASTSQRANAGPRSSSVAHQRVRYRGRNAKLARRMPHLRDRARSRRSGRRSGARLLRRSRADAEFGHHLGGRALDRACRR